MTSIEQRNSTANAVAARSARPLYSTRSGYSNMPPSADNVAPFAALLDNPLVGSFVKAHANLVTAWDASGVAMEAHTNLQDAATDADAITLRDAFRKDSSADDTGTPNADAWAVEEASLLRRFNGLGDAVADAFVEMIDAINANTDALAEVQAANATSARSRLELLLAKAAVEVDLIDVAAGGLGLLAEVALRGSTTRIRPTGSSPETLLVSGHNYLTACHLLGMISGYRAPTESEPVEGVVFDDGLGKPARRRRHA